MRHLALALLVAGCSGSSTGTPTGPCPNGTCSVSGALLFAAEVVPVSSTSQPALPSQEVAAVYVDPDNHFLLSLDRATTLDGTVVEVAANGGRTPVPASIVVSRPSRIAGRPDIYYQTRSSDKGAWSLVVSPTLEGELYTVRVQPDDDAHRPPETFLVDGSRDRTLELRVSEASTLLQVHGTITNALQVPVAGMKVQALDPKTRVSVSSTAVTDAQGNFALRLALGPTSLTSSAAPDALGMVQVVASAADKVWLPRLELPVDVTKAGPARSLTTDLSLPPLPNAVQVIYSVTGLGPSGKQDQVAGAHCVFSADVSDPNSDVRALYEVAADTAADGNASVMLIPAGDANRDYQVAVSPPSSSEFQASKTTVSVGPAGGPVRYGAPINLARRSQVTGQVLGPDGEPLKGVNVAPYAGTVAAALAPQVSALASVLTDAMGMFLLRVDNGSYDFGLTPLAATGLPRHYIEGQLIATDTLLPPVAIPPASLVTGAVQDALGMPLVGAGVRIYVVTLRNADCAVGDNTCLQPPRLIAEGTVDRAGNVSTLLPASP